MSVTRTAYSSDEYSPNKIIKTEDYESYIINHEPVTSNNITNNIRVKTNINTNTNTNVNPDEVRRTYKTFNETQKFNQSGIVKESFNHILYENKNWTQKKKYPVIEIEKEQDLTPIKTIKSVEKLKNIKTIKKVKSVKKEREFPPNFIRKRDKPRRKKKIIVKVYDYDENNANEYNNEEYANGNNFNENENVVEETVVKKIIRKEELFNKENGETFSINKTRHYKKKPIKILTE
jgi:hypothetical protein